MYARGMSDYETDTPTCGQHGTRLITVTGVSETPFLQCPDCQAALSDALDRLDAKRVTLQGGPYLCAETGRCDHAPCGTDQPRILTARATAARAALSTGG